MLSSERKKSVKPKPKSRRKNNSPSKGVISLDNMVGKSSVPLSSPKKIKKDRSSAENSSFGFVSKETYDAYSKGLFIVNFKYMVADRKTKPLSLVSVANKLSKVNIKFLEIKKNSWNSWEVLFEEKKQANFAITNKLCTELGFSTFIPRYKLSRKGVIHEIPLDILVSSLTEEIESNDYIRVKSIYRLKRKNRVSKAWEDSESVCIEFKGEELPSTIKIWKVILDVDPYISYVKICFLCGKLGHISKRCKREERCLTYAGAHPKDINCTLQQKCINCTMAHKTLDKSCSEFQKSKAITRIMTVDNLPFLRAKRIVERGSVQQPTRLPVKDQKKFSSLPSGSSSFADASRGAKSSFPRSRRYTKKIQDYNLSKNAVICIEEISKILAEVPREDLLIDRLRRMIDLHIMCLKD